MTPRVYNYRYDNVPAGAVNIDRNTLYGNQFRIGPDGTREEVVAKHRNLLKNMTERELKRFLAPLRGKNLVCWCKPKACHGDTYLELANK